MKLLKYFPLILFIIISIFFYNKIKYKQKFEPLSSALIEKKFPQLSIYNIDNDKNINKYIENRPVVINIFASWCGPCRMVGPIIDEISNDYDGKAIVGKLDVDAHQDYAAKFGVRNIPTVLLFDKGELVGRQVGVAPKKAYSDAIDAVL